MPTALIFLDKEEDDKVKEYAEKYNMSKHETIKKMIREHKDEREI